MGGILSSLLEAPRYPDVVCGVPFDEVLPGRDRTLSSLLEVPPYLEAVCVLRDTANNRMG